MPSQKPIGRYSANPYHIDALIIGSIVRLIVDHPGSPVLDYILERVYPYHLVQTEHLIIMASIHQCHATGQPLTVEAIRQDLIRREPADFCQIILKNIVEMRAAAPADFAEVESVVQDLITARGLRERDANRDRIAKLTGIGSYRLVSPTMNLVTLACGRTVRVEEVIQGRNYRGWVKNSRDLKVINEIIGEAVECASERWGIATRLMEPQVDMSDPNHPRIPLVQLAARLTCSEPVSDRTATGSRLCVVWFVEDEEFGAKPLASVIKQGIQHIPWDDWAEDQEGLDAGRP